VCWSQIVVASQRFQIVATALLKERDMRVIAPGDCDLYSSRTSASDSSLYVILESAASAVGGMMLQIRIHSDFYSLEKYSAVYPCTRNRFVRLSYKL